MGYEVLAGKLHHAEVLRAARRKEERDKRHRRELVLEEWRAKEGARYKEKLALSKDIFVWGTAFAQSKEYSKAVGFLKNRGLVYADKPSIEIFSGNWGHTFPEYGQYGCGSRLLLKPDGVLQYIAGYKWMWPITKFTIRSEGELAGRLSYDYIKELYEHLHSGRVWKDVGVNLTSAAEWAS